jgi:hypothetical protein
MKNMPLDYKAIKNKGEIKCHIGLGGNYKALLF